ncbi:uncharacterized protein LOC128726395 [Anopheles nili]|uniref:uncharacterized protein LOC128726395 n=1 Tax=Anopheles nili TaxID=185578 RepID=UPI00237ACF78|nr:uncharacterized protein LOC128726395 [Anopheles nili]
MSRWISKRKVSFLGSQAQGQKQVLPVATSPESEFEQLFRLAFLCFRPFALTPGQMCRQRDRWVVRGTRWMSLIVLVLVLAAWIALVESFFVETRTALITGIANHIQFIANTVALTAAWVVPQLKVDELSAILDGFLLIDRELSSYSVQPVPKSTRRSLFVHYSIVLAALGLLTTYDGCVSFGILTSIEPWYWLAHQLPFIVYSIAFLQAYLVIGWLQVRFRHLNALVEQYYRQGCVFTPAVKPPIVAFTTIARLDEDAPLADDLQVLAIVSRAIDLGQKIESYFGPLFLTGYTALFSVTTIQSYYCYLHLTTKGDDKGLSVETLILSGAIILANAIAIVGLPYACERVESESKRLLSYLSKLSMKHGQAAQHSGSIWFPNLISSVRFSALGFFSVNYNMLSGLVAGMVTYLIIFIQFNSMVPAGKDDEHHTRRRVQPTESDQSLSRRYPLKL